MDITLRSAQPKDQLLIHHLFQFYLYEIATEAKSSINLKIGENGLFEYDKTVIDDYFNKAKHYPYLIEVSHEVAGFSLIRHYPSNPNVIEMGQFFILGKFAGQGVGKQAFLQSLKRHPGSWQVRVLPNNQRALSFWQHCITQFSQGDYRVFDDEYKNFTMKFFQFHY